MKSFDYFYVMGNYLMGYWCVDDVIVENNYDCIVNVLYVLYLICLIFGR